MRWRLALGLGVIAALAIAIWAAVSQAGDEPPPPTSTTNPVLTTSSTEARTSSTSTTATTTTTAEPSTTTETTADPDARVEEVRQILQDLYYRWFDAIYRNDEEAVLAVVATQQGLESFQRAVDELNAERAPTLEDIQIRELEILLDEPNCLVTFAEVDLTAWRGPDARGSVVDVMWPHDSSWRFATSWSSKGDLWEQDCTGIRDNELP